MKTNCNSIVVIGLLFCALSGPAIAADELDSLLVKEGIGAKQVADGMFDLHPKNAGLAEITCSLNTVPSHRYALEFRFDRSPWFYSISPRDLRGVTVKVGSAAFPYSLSTAHGVCLQEFRAQAHRTTIVIQSSGSYPIRVSHLSCTDVDNSPFWTTHREQLSTVDKATEEYLSTTFGVKAPAPGIELQRRIVIANRLRQQQFKSSVWRFLYQDLEALAARNDAAATRQKLDEINQLMNEDIMQ